MDTANNELIRRIKAGEEDLIPPLWDQVRGSLHYYSYEYYRSHKSRCDTAGIDEHDLMQESYFAFLKTLSTYDVNRDYSFITHLRWPCKNHFAECVRLRGSKKKMDKLSGITISLDSSVSGENDLMYSETIPDPDAEEACRVIEHDQLQLEVRSAVARLPEREHTITNMYALQGHSFKDCSKTLGVKESTLRSQFNDAKRRLYSMPDIRRIWFDYYSSGLKGTGLKAYRNHGFTSSVESAPIKMLDFSRDNN